MNHSSPTTFTPEMRQWLSDNREDYEFYILHAMMHDPLYRSSLLNAPVLQSDFRREEFALVVLALTSASKIMRVVGGSIPTPPSPEWLSPYLKSAARELSSDDEVVAMADILVHQLQDEKYKEQHYCINPYFEAWYGSVRAKQAAKDINMVDIPDIRGAVARIEDALASAADAVQDDKSDPYLSCVNGTDVERPPRSSTGIEGLDQSLNGGWGSGESYLVFGGTSGGKSIIASQCAWHEAKSNNGYPLIVSTELEPREYVMRMISCGCAVPIDLIQDCENFAQIRQAITSDLRTIHKKAQLETALKLLSDRVFVAKISADEGMDARAILNRELLRFERRYRRKPTWLCLDWLGSVADPTTRGRGGSAERAMDWEFAATSCVKFAETSGIPTMVLAQAVNDTQSKRVLTIGDIGISKGIGKNMTAVIGLTNSIDKAAAGKNTDSNQPMFHKLQRLCVCKSRKGEGRNIPIQRDFTFQRFITPTAQAVQSAATHSSGKCSTDDATAKEVEEVFGKMEFLAPGDLLQRIAKVRGIIPGSAKAHRRKYLNLKLIEKTEDGKYRATLPETQKV